MNGFCKVFLENFFDLLSLNLEHQDLEGRPKFAFGNNGHRLVKRVILCLGSANEENKRVLEGILEKFIGVVERNIEAFLQSKGIFIIIAILEHSDFQESFLMILRKYGNVVKALPKNTGVEVLLKLLDAKNGN